MKTRNTLILLVLATGVYFYLRYYESRRPGTEEAEAQSSRLLVLDRDKIDGISIHNSEARIELRRAHDEWRMEEPVKDKADDAVVQDLLDSVEDMQKEASLNPEGSHDQVKELGLVKPNVTLQLLGKDAPPAILFGKDTAVEGKEYVRLANADEVFVVSDELRGEVTKPADDFRDHRLVSVPGTDVTKVNITTGAGEIEIEKAHDHWQINRPIRARGDDGRIVDMVAQTLNSRVEAFVKEDQEAVANAALNEAQGSIAFTVEGTDKPVVLELSKSAEGQKLYAKVSNREAVLLTGSAAAVLLGLTPADLRDRHLIRLDLDTVDRIHVAPAGAPEILLARKGETWTIKNMGDRRANSGDVQRMAAGLQNQLVTAFVSDVATDLARYGLDAPRLKVTFSSYATDNTAETKAGEQPLETVLFGKTEGDQVYAKLDDEPFIVSLPKGVPNAIHPDWASWQDPVIYALKPGDIAGLEITRDGQAPLDLVREKGEWHPAKGDIVLNTENLDAIAAKLAALRALRWVGPQRPDQGLDKPAVTIAFTKTGGTREIVKIGSPVAQAAAEPLWNASATGAEGTFLIGKADHDALAVDPLPQPK